MIYKNTSYDNIAVWWQLSERTAKAVFSLRTPKPLFLKSLNKNNYEQIKGSN